jgi:hypothetical protein
MTDLERANLRRLTGPPRYETARIVLAAWGAVVAFAAAELLVWWLG